MLPYLFVLIAVAARFLPHAGSSNFTPVAAALLFFGSRVPLRRAWIPVALFAASDVILSRFVYGYPLGVSDVATWAWYAAIVCLGSLLASNVSILRVGASSLVASISFFVVSNFMVWAGWTMYSHSFAGLMQCYTAAVPFFRNTAASDMLFSAIFFGLGALLPVTNRAGEHA
jgi:membrane-associated HD superfamily phosphohydrolase